MAARLSTGLVKKLMDTAPFKTIFDGCFIDIYSGTQPASADDVPTGTKLVTLYSNGTSAGLHFEAVAAGGVATKLASESWTGTALADGVAGWFRVREATDAGTAASTTVARYDGAIAASGGQMTLANTTVTNGAPFVIAAAAFTLPKA